MFKDFVIICFSMAKEVLDTITESGVFISCAIPEIPILLEFFFHEVADLLS
ncbi:hypothetical protein [Streptococcus pyogenes]|uniref:hypothetical protein n=1 Tax=Streptococcus pyogenes TaxID=1314 RepID=UPI001F6241FF|nr:hypothetical protein [Streptococcus pyogenes]